jgi:hypothetical protein
VGNYPTGGSVKTSVKRLLPVFLVLVVSGCFGGHSAATRTDASAVAPTGHLSLTIKRLAGRCSLGAPNAKCPALPVRRFSLTCGPAGGSAPNPAAACHAIADYLKHIHHLGGCIGTLSGPGSTATITGTFANRPFHLQLEAGYSWCGQSRPVLRDFWVLSTFPCSTLVLREGGGPDPRRWARATGCSVDSA